jgi:long-chain acyl-CoA synthetase
LPANTPIPPPPAPGQQLDPLVAKLASNQKFKEAVMKDITAVGKREKLRGFEFLKAIHLESKLFTAEDGLLTPTFKIKRNVAADKFRGQIDFMYQEIESKNPKSAKL